MTGWLIALGIVLALACLPLGFDLRYDGAGLQAMALAGPVCLRLYPQPTRGKKSPKKNEKAQPSPKAPEDGPPPGAPTKKLEHPKSGGNWTEFLPLLDDILDALSSLWGRLRLRQLVLHLTIAGEDPADVAIAYGRAQGAVEVLRAQLHRFLIIRREDIRVCCDFTGTKCQVVLHWEGTITLGRAVSWAVCYGWKLLCTHQRIKQAQENADET